MSLRKAFDPKWQSSHANLVLLGNSDCLGRPQGAHGWSDQPMNRTLTMLPHHVRVDGCMCVECVNPRKET